MRFRLVGLLALMALVLASCGGNSGDDSSDPTTAGSGDEPTETTQPETTGNDGVSREFPFETGDGFFEVDGERYEVQVIRCIPDEAERVNLELIGWVGGTSTAFEVWTSTRQAPGEDADYETTQFDSELQLNGNDGLMAFSRYGLNEAPDGGWYSASAATLARNIDNQEPLEDAPIVIDGSSVSGVVQMEQTHPDGASGMPVVTYEFQMATQEVDCDSFFG